LEKRVDFLDGDGKLTSAETLAALGITEINLTADAIFTVEAQRGAGGCEMPGNQDEATRRPLNALSP